MDELMHRLISLNTLFPWPFAQSAHATNAELQRRQRHSGTALRSASRPPGRAPQRPLRSPRGSSATSTRRQDGQEECERSQASTQAAWNAWLHCGSTRMCWPSSNSARQMAHSSASDASPPSAAYLTVGSARSTSFLTPLLAPGGAASAGRAQRREHAHRATRPRPRTQTSAQSRPARMRTRSELSESCCAPAATASSRSLLAAMSGHRERAHELRRWLASR
ncbi:hypothetical protein VPH35_117668 [Triticum aestivum]|uniref:Uncharacterized protein n=1 Tax=Aegilops tauschii subsp. strangulata TaxID=200361 RepID=A0A453PAJ3_AEGTS